MTLAGVDPGELRRHAPVGRPRRASADDHPRGLAHLYAARKRRPLPDLFVTDQAEARRGGGFRWFFSTCLAAAVGAVAIGAVIFGSLDLTGDPGRLLASVEPSRRPVPSQGATAVSIGGPGLAWNIPKSARLQTTSDAISTRYIVQAAMRERRGTREYLHHKPFARIMIRLAAVEADSAVAIPTFNPLKLFSSPADKGGGEGSGGVATAPEGGEVTLRVIELLGSIIPAEDSQEMDTQEVSELVVRALVNESDAAPIRASFAPDGLASGLRGPSDAPLAPNTTLLAKTSVDADEIETEGEGERTRLTVARGETLGQILARMGADAWFAREMIEAQRNILPETRVKAGYEVDVVLVPSLSKPGSSEPIGYSVYDAAGAHKVTVTRNEAGEPVASATEPRRARARPESGAASIYSSVYHGALAQGIPAETIESIVKVHAYETDFRRRARGSDAVELFFDLQEGSRGADGALGELLMSALTVGGETQRFYRFKGPDGVVDFYDPGGNNSRRFLLRKPVRSEDARLTSGFGLRLHPLLNQRKLHTGLDWAAPTGTPIIAAGNGIIEEAGYKGQYGNYVRIRHANYYQTAYAHMRGFAKGIRTGLKVRQGEVIGYLGSTGLSSGPHLHFEVLVGSRFVDPLKISVPREKQLAGRQLAAFQRERVRIDELMRRPPVSVRTIEARR